MRSQLTVVGILIVCSLGGLATSCSSTSAVAQPQGAGDVQTPTIPVAPTPTETTSPPVPTPPGPIAPPTMWVTEEPGVNLMSEEEAVALAKRTLAEHLGVAEEAIELVWIGRVTWPDTSLGCPQKGVMYAQVLIPGYQVILEVGGKTYKVHTGPRHAVVCPQGLAGAPGSVELPLAWDVGR